MSRSRRPRAFVQAASRHVDDPARPFRQCRDQGAEPEAGRGHPRAHHRLRRAPRRSRRHGHRHAARHAAAAAVLLHGAARHRGRRPRAWSTTASPNTSRSKPDRFVGARHRAADRRQRGRQGARALHEDARHEGRRDPHQRRRAGAVRARLRAVLEEGRGARRARAASIPTASPTPSASRASISTT